MRIGLISDTHGLLRPEVMDILRGCDHIVHAGDVGDPEILTRLRAVAPLTVARGNVDHGAWAYTLPVEDVAEVDGRSIYVTHNLDYLHIDPKAAGMDVLVFGHTHHPEKWIGKDGVLYVNPGSCGPRRFNLPVSCAVLTTGSDLEVEFVELEPTPAS